MQVNELNKDNIVVPNATGTAKYDPTTNTLTLDHFSYTETSDSAGIHYSKNAALTVNLVGSNTVVCSADFGCALRSSGALTIVGNDASSSLALTGGNFGVWASGNLVIKNCQVTATGNALNGITGNGTIAITNSFVEATGAKTGISIVHAEEGSLVPMKSDDLTITNSTVVATGGRDAMYYDGGDTGVTNYSGGLIPQFVFSNKFAALAGEDADGATAAAKDERATYKNKHVRIVYVYDVTYKADGNVVKAVEVEHGKDAPAPEIPAKVGYSAAWDKDGKNITADTTINAVYAINTYTVTYKADGKVVKTLTVEHGKDAAAPEIPAKVGYDETAPKWDADGKNITADMTINAIYTKNQPGEYADVTPETNVGGGKLTEEIAELKEKVPFTQEEEKQIEYGADVEVWLEINDISASVSAEDKAKIDEKLGDADAAMYLDVAMFKQVGKNEASRLTQLNDKVQITFKLADSHINTDENVTRTYSIIHVHDGKTEIITPVFDAAAKTLTFLTDRFSTYAVVYADVVTTPPSWYAHSIYWSYS